MKKQKTHTLHREGSCKHGLCGTQLLTVSKQLPLPLHSNTLRNEPKSPGCNINPAIPITHTDVPPLFSFMHILIKRSESSIKMLLNSLFPCSLYAIYYAFSEGLLGVLRHSYRSPANSGPFSSPSICKRAFLGQAVE